MAVFNHSRKEIDAKIVYYGPGLSGKTTNLQFIHQNLKPDQRGKMVSLATNEERTLFFDFLPIELESVRGFKTRFHLYTVPGQAYYGATRRAVLSGADGVIFVADSQAEKIEDNLLSYKDLEENLCYYRKTIENTPLILQYNKRDLPNILPLEELNQKINRLKVPYFESVAISGKGVFETLTMTCRLILRAIEEGAEARKSVRKPEMTQEKLASSTAAVGKEVGSFAAPRDGQGLSQERAFRPEKSVFPIEAVPLMSEGTLPKRIKPEKKIFSTQETFFSGVSAPGSISGIVIPKNEIEMQKTNGRSIFSRMFGKIKPGPNLSPTEEPQKVNSAIPEKMRIISCGQPRIFSPGKFKISLTLGIEGVTKSFPVNLEINIENGEPKAD